MKQLLISVLRNRHSTLAEFRQAADQLATVLASESAEFLHTKSIPIETPLAKTTGKALDDQVILISILRAGLTFLSPFMKFYPDALIGFVGARRDEKTAKPQLYYTKFPPCTKDNPVLLLDPMLATGGSCCLAIKLLIEAGAEESNITLISAIAAPEGIQHLKAEYPAVHLIVAQVDEYLDERKFIFPGLGDFGDRYFGTIN